MNIKTLLTIVVYFFMSVTEASVFALDDIKSFKSIEQTTTSSSTLSSQDQQNSEEVVSAIDDELEETRPYTDSDDDEPAIVHSSAAEITAPAAISTSFAAPVTTSSSFSSVSVVAGSTSNLHAQETPSSSTPIAVASSSPFSVTTSAPAIPVSQNERKVIAEKKETTSSAEKSASNFDALKNLGHAINVLSEKNIAQGKKQDMLCALKILWAKQVLKTIAQNKIAVYRGLTPLTLAVGMGNSSAVSILLKNETLVNEPKTIMPLFVAAAFGHTQIVDMLLKQNIDINAQSCGGYTALMFACMYNNATTAEKLINTYNADINISDDNGYTALMWAAQNGCTKIVKAILKKKLEIDSTPYDNIEGAASLLLAATNNHSSVVDRLFTSNICKKLTQNEAYQALNIAQNATKTPEIYEPLVEKINTIAQSATQEKQSEKKEQLEKHSLPTTPLTSAISQPNMSINEDDFISIEDPFMAKMKKYAHLGGLKLPGTTCKFSAHACQRMLSPADSKRLKCLYPNIVEGRDISHKEVKTLLEKDIPPKKGNNNNLVFSDGKLTVVTNNQKNVIVTVYRNGDEANK